MNGTNFLRYPMNTMPHCPWSKRIALFVLLSIQPASAQFVWNAASEFSNTNGNPNGVWTYGWMDTGFTTFTAFSTTTYNGSSPMWGGTPEVWLNTSGSISYGIPPGYLSLHPGPGTEPAVLRWTAPAGVTGSVGLSGQFLAGDGGSMQVAVRQGNTVLWSAVDAGSFMLTASGISPGSVIDFAVFGGYYAGNTGLGLTISAVPEPSTYAMIAIGGIALLGFTLARRRREALAPPGP